MFGVEIIVLEMLTGHPENAIPALGRALVVSPAVLKMKWSWRFQQTLAALRQRTFSKQVL